MTRCRRRFAIQTGSERLAYYRVSNDRVKPLMPQKNVFISYAHEDSGLKDHFLMHLRPLMYDGGIDLWDDTRIGAGQRWEREIETALESASAAVLLISAAFLNSQFIREREVPQLLERNKSGRLPIMPIILKPCVWRKVKWLKEMQVRLNGEHAISEGSEAAIDSCFSKLAEEVAAMLSPEETLALKPTPETTNTPDQRPAAASSTEREPAEPRKFDPRWTPELSATAKSPQCSLGVPLIFHNQVRGGIYFMELQVQGQLRNALNRQAQIAARFCFQNGPMLVANAREAQYRDSAGYVCAYSQRFPVSSDAHDLGQFRLAIPYYAFNLLPTGMRTSYQLTAFVEAYVDEALIGRGDAAPFFVVW